MRIDLHTHAFPDAIATKTIQKLAAIAGQHPCHDGTVAGLCRAMREGDVDRSVVLPVVTAPKQFDSINRFAAEHNGRDGLVFFGGIHPDNDRPEQRLDEIRAMGLRGIKLHPDYQDTFLGDARYVRIVRHCVEHAMPVVIHAGRDPLSPDTVHASVAEIERLLNGVYRGAMPQRPFIVLAHLGGEGQLEEVQQRLCGAPVYLDTANMLDRTPPEQVMRLVRRHGAKRVLFATDSPWGEPADFAARLDALPLTADEREDIAWRNAAALLGLSAEDIAAL